MRWYGIQTSGALGVSLPELRKLARTVDKNHAIAPRLWKSGIHEARILASLVDVPREVTEGQMDKWVRDLDS